MWVVFLKDKWGLSYKLSYSWLKIIFVFGRLFFKWMERVSFWVGEIEEFLEICVDVVFFGFRVIFNI